MEGGKFVCLLVFAILLLFVNLADAGECCIGTTEQIWCGSYCCESPTSLFCCDNFFIRASPEYRQDMCLEFFRVFWYYLGFAVVGGILVIGFAAYSVYYYWFRPQTQRATVYPSAATTVISYPQGLQVGYTAASPGQATVQGQAMGDAPPVTLPAPPDYKE